MKENLNVTALKDQLAKCVPPTSWYQLGKVQCERCIQGFKVDQMKAINALT